MMLNRQLKTAPI